MESVILYTAVTAEFKTNVKAEEELENTASCSQKTLMLKTIMKLEKLMHFRKVATNADNDIVMFKHGFDEEHNCVLAKVLVITTVIKPMDMPVKYSLLMFDVNVLDISKKPFSFPWRPGDLLCWVCSPAMMFVLVLQLLAMLMESRVYSVMTTTAACVKSDMEAEDSEVELLKPEPCLPVFDDEDTDQGQEEDVLENQAASADNIMVL